MELELRFFATFREAVGGKTVHREFGDDATVGDVLAALESEYDGLDGQLLHDGELREHLSVLRNGRDVVHEEGLDTPLSDGDTVSVFPPVAGGDDRPVPRFERPDGGDQRHDECGERDGSDARPSDLGPGDLPDDVYPPGWRGETIFWFGED